jgi:hypothetical protein
MSLSPLEYIRHILDETAYLSTQAGDLGRYVATVFPLTRHPHSRIGCRR